MVSKRFVPSLVFEVIGREDAGAEWETLRCFLVCLLGRCRTVLATGPVCKEDRCYIFPVEEEEMGE
jgi:hypothetical protein